MKRLLVLIVLSLFTILTFADFSGELTDSQGVKYTANEDGTTCYVSGFVTSYQPETGLSYSSTVEIPEVFNGRQVTSIIGAVFRNCYSLKKITIPSSVKWIGYSAFENCTGLSTLTIPGNVSTGYSAFAGCTGLTSISFPGGVDLGSYAFKGCINLESAYFPLAVDFIGNAFDGCTELKYVVLPRKLYSDDLIYNYFGDCKKLKDIYCYDKTPVQNTLRVYNYTTVTLHVPAESVDDYKNNYYWKKFENIVALEAGDPGFDWNYPDNTIIFDARNTRDFCLENWDTDNNGCLTKQEAAAVTDIGKPSGDVYDNFHEFQYFTGITSIPDSAFYGKGIHEITLPNTITSIGNWAFSGSSFSSLPNSITFIGDGAFSGCNFTDLILPDGITSIGKETFKETNIGSIRISENVEKISDYAFNQSTIESIEIPSSVTTMGRYVFYSCSKLKTVYLHARVKTLVAPFVDCTSLKDLYCSSPKKINVGEPIIAFQNVPLDNATLHVPAELLEQYKNDYYWKKFGNIVALKEGDPGYVVPKDIITFASANVKMICIENWDIDENGELSKDEAEVVKDLGEVFNYSNLKSFEELQYFTNLESIGNNAFKSSSLNSIIIPNSVKLIGNEAFYSNLDLTTITIPNSVTSIGNSAFSGCGLTSITIPNSVITIGEYAFASCKLTSITIPSSVTSIGKGAFSGCKSLTEVIVNWSEPIAITEDVFRYYDSETNSYKFTSATLFVPAGTKTKYKALAGWCRFKNIIELGDLITIGDAEIVTFCSDSPLDFSNVNDIDAYIVSAFKPSTGEVTLTRITDVPANTGIVVTGAAGTYSIPMGPGETIVSNMLRGVTTNTVLNKVEGDYTNYILAKKNGNLGFYAVVDGSTLSAHKAYLPLPTASLPSSARSIKLVFEDGETTGISEASPLNDNGEIQNDNVYDLQGRRVEKPTRGLYIVNGRKIVIK